MEKGRGLEVRNAFPGMTDEGGGGGGCGSGNGGGGGCGGGGGSGGGVGGGVAFAHVPCARSDRL